MKKTFHTLGSKSKEHTENDDSENLTIKQFYEKINLSQEAIINKDKRAFISAFQYMKHWWPDLEEIERVKIRYRYPKLAKKLDEQVKKWGS